MIRWIRFLLKFVPMLLGVAITSAPAYALTINDVQKLLASDGDAGVLFGETVAIDGDTAVIGAIQNREHGDSSGAVYVFNRDATGMWTEHVKLLASDAVERQFFGNAVAISGDMIVVGAIGDNDKGRYTGSAYIFIRDATGAWHEQAELLARDGAEGDAFGYSVAVSGDTVVVGAIYVDNSDVMNSGAAYVFVKDAENNWSEQAKLVPDNPAAHDLYGNSVAVSGDTVLIGRQHLGFNIGTGAGATRVFTRDASGSWREQPSLMASDGFEQDGFGAGGGFRLSFSGFQNREPSEQAKLEPTAAKDCMKEAGPCENEP
ncbi:MAG: FG-GAP repeat protein [Gammaproteobacteria bacterium]